MINCYMGKLFKLNGISYKLMISVFLIIDKNLHFYNNNTIYWQLGTF